jgi:hypothetical protein
VNNFRLIRTYHGHPSGVPTSEKSDFLMDNLQPTQEPTPSFLPKKKSVKDIIHPYPNFSSFLFNRWHWDSSKKTKKGCSDFIKLMAKHPDFKINDITSVNFDCLDEKLAQNPGTVVEDNGWTNWCFMGPISCLFDIFFQLTIESRGLDIEGPHLSPPSLPEHSALRAFRKWQPTSQITQFLEDLCHVPDPAYQSLDVLKYHQQEGGVVDNLAVDRRALEEWHTGVHDQNLDDLDNHQELSSLHEVSTHFLQESILM